MINLPNIGNYNSVSKMKYLAAHPDLTVNRKRSNEMEKRTVESCVLLFRIAHSTPIASDTRFLAKEREKSSAPCVSSVRYRNRFFEASQKAIIVHVCTLYSKKKKPSRTPPHLSSHQFMSGRNGSKSQMPTSTSSANMITLPYTLQTLPRVPSSTSCLLSKALRNS